MIIVEEQRKDTERAEVTESTRGCANWKKNLRQAFSRLFFTSSWLSKQRMVIIGNSNGQFRPNIRAAREHCEEMYLKSIASEWEVGVAMTCTTDHKAAYIRAIIDWLRLVSYAICLCTPCMDEYINRVQVCKYWECTLARCNIPISVDVSTAVLRCFYSKHAAINQNESTERAMIGMVPAKRRSSVPHVIVGRQLHDDRRNHRHCANRLCCVSIWISCSAEFERANRSPCNWRPSDLMATCARICLFACISVFHWLLNSYRWRSFYIFCEPLQRPFLLFTSRDLSIFICFPFQAAKLRGKATTMQKWCAHKRHWAQAHRARVVFSTDSFQFAASSYRTSLNEHTLNINKI